MLFRFVVMLGTCCALLLGLQIPAFSQQYMTRLDAHLSELTANLRGFQEIANQNFHGSLDALIFKHMNSQDRVFHDEGLVIRRLYLRLQHYQGEREMLDTSWYRQLYLIPQQGDKELIRETWAGYTPDVTLNGPSLYCGLLLVIVVLVFSEIAAAGIRLFRPGVPRHMPSRF